MVVIDPNEPEPFLTILEEVKKFLFHYTDKIREHKRSIIWTTKDGREIHSLDEIDDNHLYNIVRMLERRRAPQRLIVVFKNEAVNRGLMTLTGAPTLRRLI